MNDLSKYSSVVVVNSKFALLSLSQRLRGLPPCEQTKHFGQAQHAGGVFMFADPAVLPNCVLECVRSHDGDAISSVYRTHPIFNTVGELLRARAELVRALAEKIGMSPESVGIHDEARGRLVGLSELATGQLIDLLGDKMGRVIAETDSHMIDGQQHAANKLLEGAELVEGDIRDAGVLVQTPEGVKAVALGELES